MLGSEVPIHLVAERGQGAGEQPSRRGDVLPDEALAVGEERVPGGAHQRRLEDAHPGVIPRIRAAHGLAGGPLQQPRGQHAGGEGALAR